MIDRVEGSAFTGRIAWPGIATLKGTLTNPVMGLHFGNQVLFVDKPSNAEHDSLFALNGVKEAVIINVKNERKVALVGTASPYQFVMVAIREGTGPVPERTIEQLPEGGWANE